VAPIEPQQSPPTCDGNPAKAVSTTVGAGRASSAFEVLVDAAASADVSGWGFSWLDGRATEQRPSWGYQRLLGERLARASAAVDLQTGGGEVLDGVPVLPLAMAATESWSPNVRLATARLHPRGVVVVAVGDDAPLPFGDEAFDLVCSRHPATVQWAEIARVLRPGGEYFAQHVGPRTNEALYEYFLGPQRNGVQARDPGVDSEAARAVGLEVIRMQMERLRVEFFDVGAVV